MTQILWYITFSDKINIKTRGIPLSEEANVLDSDIVVSKFKLQLGYYVHFWTNTLGKGMNSLIPPAMV